MADDVHVVLRVDHQGLNLLGLRAAELAGPELLSVGSVLEEHGIPIARLWGPVDAPIRRACDVDRIFAVGRDCSRAIVSVRADLPCPLLVAGRAVSPQEAVVPPKGAAGEPELDPSDNVEVRVGIERERTADVGSEGPELAQPPRALHALADVEGARVAACEHATVDVALRGATVIAEIDRVADLVVLDDPVTALRLALRLTGASARVAGASAASVSP